MELPEANHPVSSPIGETTATLSHPVVTVLRLKRHFLGWYARLLFVSQLRNFAKGTGSLVHAVVKLLREWSVIKCIMTTEFA